MNGYENTLYLADCLDLLREWYAKGQTNFIDLTYIDPPFNSNRNYNVIFDSKLSEEAFTDTWSSVSYLDELEGITSMSPNLYNFLKLLETTGLPKSYISYLTKMSIRCWYIREMLKDTGSFYYHCDPTMSHYIKIMLDYVFGMINFRNEIVWAYGKWTAPSSHFQKNHDIILRYSKTNTFKFNTIKEIDKKRQITLDRGYTTNLLSNGDRQLIVYKGNESRPNIKKLMKSPKFTRTLVIEPEGNPISDHWQINFLHPRAKERLGYPTQKPEKLLERIILASSNEGDLVADFFIGGGTTIATAIKNNRKFIGVDINSRAIQITKERIEKLHLKLKQDFFIHGIPRSAGELRKMILDNVYGKDKNSRFALEEITTKHYLNNVVGNEKKVGDHSIDGYFMFKFNGKQRTGLVQVTTGAGINHFKSFCSEISKGTGELGVYITFQDKITNGIIREAKSYGTIGNVDKIQILPFEKLIDEGKQYELPKDILTI
jgi:site-specific DNA-methyltransferase (adenine-specific)